MTNIQSSKLFSNPFVSVIIPSFNRENTIGATIDSIINQKTNFDFEIIIGDDCSTDNAREVLVDYQKKYPDKIVLLFHDENIGLGANWATCVKYCRGKYIANCDNDDYWHNPDKLQLQVDFLEANSDYGVCHTNYRNHHRETGTIHDVIVSNDAFDVSLQQAIFSGKFRCCNATMMYRKKLIDKYINLDDFIRLQFTLQDWNTWIILAKYTQFYCLPISTATFGIETISITRPSGYEKIIKRFEKEKECYKYVCDLFPDELVFDNVGYDSYVLFVLLNQAYNKFDYKVGKQYALDLNKLGLKNLKISMANYWITFCLFAIIKRIRKIE